MRKISETERERLLKEIKAIWGWNKHYWYPLSEVTRHDVLALHTEKFTKQVSASALREILNRLHVQSVIRVREIDESEELSVGEIPHFEGSEDIFFDSTGSWIIYSSHEDSITFGGLPLISEVKKV